jgi:RND family efflux transporter MFP subunit
MKRALLASLLTACAAQDTTPAANEPEVAVARERAEPQVLTEDPGYVGVLLPSAATDVAPGYEGKLDSIHVQVGQWIEQGTPIASFDPSAAREALAMAQADLRVARGEAAEAAALSRHASRKLRTERELLKQGITAADTVADAHAERMRTGAATSSAAGRIGAAKARIEQLERQLEETDLVAPFSGQVALVYRESGAMADPARPVVRLIDTARTFVRFAVPPPETNGLAVGDEVDVIVDWLEQPMTARVRQIAPEVDAPTGLVFLEAELSAGDIPHVRPHSPAWVRKRGT